MMKEAKDKIKHIRTAKQASEFLKDFIDSAWNGKYTNDEAHQLLMTYTWQIESIFWRNAVEKIRKNPKLLKKCKQ